MLNLIVFITIFFIPMPMWLKVILLVCTGFNMLFNVTFNSDIEEKMI